MEEIEAKFLEIKENEIVKKLEAIGAQKEFELLYRRRVFDFPDYRLNENHSWLRLRDEGEKITLAYKKRFGIGDDKFKDEGMYETEIMVSDFEKTADLLRAIGMVEKFYEENKRVKYIFNDVDFCIDSWPLIPTYLEIEGKSWDDVEKATLALGLDWEDHIRCSTSQIYRHYGIVEKSYKILTFSEQIKRET